MLNKHLVLFGISIAVLLILIATTLYPGGSMFDKNSIGFDWSKNFISNLFAAKAVNGSDNPFRFWAISGMIFLSVSFALFFIKFSDRIPDKSSAKVIKFLGSGAMLFTFLIVTPLHDAMVALSATLHLVNLFYITVFIFKSQRHFFKILCIIYLIIFYYTLYLYGFGYYDSLPIMQKIVFGSTVILILLLQYSTSREDFEHIRTKQVK